jgi:spore coat protein SA
VKVGFLNQPWDGSLPPNPGESLAIWTWEVGRCLARSRDVVVVARRHRTEPGRVTQEGVEYIRIPLLPARVDRLATSVLVHLRRVGGVRMPIFATSMRYLGFAVSAARAFRANRCDVVHIHNFSQFVPIVRRFNPRARIVLHMNCDWLTQLKHEVIDSRLRHADAILGCSEYVTGNIRTRFPHYAARCVTVYNGAELNQFYPGDSRRTGSSGTRIIFVGRISPEKGVHILLDAFERVVRIVPDAQLEIIGGAWVAPREFIVDLSDEPAVRRLSCFYDTNYLTSLHLRIRGPLEKRVSFAGGIPHSVVLERMREANVSVVPSVWSEPFGMPAVEAMAMGIPVVASRVGGLTEIVKEGITGLLVQPDDPPALANALLRIIADKGMAEAMGRAGRERVDQLFSWNGIAERVQALYDTLCC